MQKNNSIWKYLSFGTLAALILAMVAATILEKLKGTPEAFRVVYHNPVFMVLWAVTAISGIVWLCKRGVPRKLFTMGLHCAFVLILAGALITHIGGKSGEIHLLLDRESSAFTEEDGTVQELPFSLRLEKFTVTRYPGSMAPADFSSTVTLLPEGETRVISMNHILKYKGYRFYQADFDPDMRGSILAVSHDPWGVGVTYAGYLLLLVSMIGFFFQKDSHFRTVLSRVMQASVLAVGLFLFPSCHPERSEGSASEGSASEGSVPKVLPEEVADAFGDLYVYYGDRVCPLSTQTRDYCLKAYGKASWNGFSANQVVSGWLFYYDWWRGVPFKVKAKDKGTPREAEKGAIQRSASTGAAFKLFPEPDAEGQLHWYSCQDPLPPEILSDEAHWTFIRKVLDMVGESVQEEDWPEVLRLLGKIKAYQEKNAGEVLPSASKVKAERIWGRLARPMVPFMASLTLGILMFILSGALLSRGKKTPRALQTALAAVALVLWIYLTLTIGLRWYVSGHGPFAGTYNVMMLMAWLATTALLLLYRKFPLIQPLGFILAGFTMLQASMAGANPQITHLMPVLQSPLLSLHVLSMMISYTLFGLVALNGVMGLVVPGKAAKERLRDVSLVVLYPAVFLITFGTFLGAVWANISWGSYWGWDPKETWALVTLLIYAFTLHGRSLKCFRNPNFFHMYTILAFLSVLITYFGVNLLLGGMHSYA